MWNIFSCIGSNPAPGTFAYQVFNKVPQIPIGGIAQFLQTGNLQQLIGNINDINNFAKNANNFIGNIGQIANIANNRGVETLIPQGSSGIDFSAFINNVAKQSVKGTDSNLKQLIQTSKGSVIKKILKSNYAEVMKKQKQKGGKWTDPDFPPDQSSIGNFQDMPVRSIWKRIPEVIKNAKFVQGIIQPSDALQGSIGDCYFLSAISALSQNQFRIKNLFPTLQTNQYGIYMARILYNGVIRQVVVDDYIPVTPQNNPLFAKPAGGNQIWVMILQKCWAKLHGSYGAIVGGLPNQVLHAFSGAPTFYHPMPTDNQQQQQLWANMTKSYKEGSILCCGTKSSAVVQKSGLVLGHAYTILNVYEKPTRLLKLRNPWGNKQWIGRASQQDMQFWSKISPADKQMMGFKQANDGIFYMLWQDFANYFALVDICKINDNANYINLQFDINRKRGQMFQFQLTQPGKVTIGLSQSSLRGQSEDIQAKGYSRATLVVAKKEDVSKGHDYKYVGSTSSRKFAELALQLQNLVVGTYVIFAKMDWLSQNSQKANISIYSLPKVILKKSKQSNHDKFLFTTFLDHARKNNKKQILNDKIQQWMCSQFLLNESGYGYLAFHLDEKSQRKIGIEIDQQEFTKKRLTLKKPYKGQGIIKTMVEPGKQLIILFRMKSQNYPKSITIPNPKIYNLV